MVKLVLKLAIVGLIANALWQTVPPYYDNLRFTDALKELATFPSWRDTVPTIKGKCAKIAQDYGLDLAADDFQVTMHGAGQGQTATIDVSYEVVMKPIPGRKMPHVFIIHAEPEAKRFGSLTP
jgi:hypothetical protein